MHEALPSEIIAFRKQNGLNVDEEQSLIWMATLGPLILPLPNFRWRREIVAKHDGHHLITGYDTSAKGELLVAAWEAGAKCYDDWRARTLCMALMALGILRYPEPTWRAFKSGRNRR